MAKTTERKKKISPKSKNIPTSYKPIILEDGACFVGWENMDSLVQSVYRTGISQILQGRLVFAFQPLSSEIPLRQLIIVKNPEKWEGDVTGKYTYSISEITNGWTMYSPTYDYNQLEIIILSDLEKYSVPSDIIEIYKSTIEKFKIIYNNTIENIQ